MMFDINCFIGNYITKRPQSMFIAEIMKNKAEVKDIIEGKTVLIIGGAGTIASSFIKAVILY